MSDIDKGLWDFDDYIKAHGEPAINSMYPHDVSDQELATGFQKMVVPNVDGHYFLAPRNMVAVVRHLGAAGQGAELLAIKMSSPAGDICYGIVDSERMRPREGAAETLADLAQRFPQA